MFNPTKEVIMENGEVFKHKNWTVFYKENGKVIVNGDFFKHIDELEDRIKKLDGLNNKKIECLRSCYHLIKNFAPDEIDNILNRRQEMENSGTPGNKKLEKEIDRLNNKQAPLGWICPVCGRGNGPFSSICPCIPLSSR